MVCFRFCFSVFQRIDSLGDILQKILKCVTDTPFLSSFTDKQSLSASWLMSCHIFD